MKFATDLLMDRVVYEFLNKLAHPKVVGKLIMKKMDKQRRRRHRGDASLN